MHITAFTLMSATGCAMLLAGTLAVLLAVVGAMRLKLFFERLQSYGVIDSMGAFLIALGIILAHEISLVSFKILIMLLLAFFTSAVSSTLLAHVAMILDDEDVT